MINRECASVISREKNRRELLKPLGEMFIYQDEKHTNARGSLMSLTVSSIPGL
jgi:hypothetical protein